MTLLNEWAGDMTEVIRVLIGHDGRFLASWGLTVPRACGALVTPYKTGSVRMAEESG